MRRESERIEMMGSLRSLHKESKEATEAERQFRKFLIDMAEYGILTPEAQNYWGVRKNQTETGEER